MKNKCCYTNSVENKVDNENGEGQPANILGEIIVRQDEVESHQKKTGGDGALADQHQAAAGGGREGQAWESDNDSNDSDRL